jgi:predicted unusual protein kinase regulating ubiquinone biosynthesis (AarF/ABC1/UbiB family)
MLANAIERSDLDLDRFQSEIGALMARYRMSSLKDIQLGPILQEMTEISVRFGVPLPASLALTGKALAQMQLATAQLDPDLDPFEVAGRFLTRSLLRGMTARIDPKAVFYQSQKLKVRAMRVVEALERMIGARPGQKMEINFRAAPLEATVRRAGRHLALGLTAGAAILASGLTAMSVRVPGWVPVTFGIAGALLTFGLLLDLFRKRSG